MSFRVDVFRADVLALLPEEAYVSCSVTFDRYESGDSGMKWEVYAHSSLLLNIVGHNSLSVVGETASECLGRLRSELGEES